MKKIYIPQGGGRDFWLRIPMNNESAGRHLCMDDVHEEDLHVWLESGYGGCWTLEKHIDGGQRDGIAAKVPASTLGYGTYSVVMAGKFVNGDYFRTKRQLFIRLVDREDQADAEPTMYNEEQAYWAGPAVLSEMLSRDGLNTYELAVIHGFEGTLEEYLEISGLELQDLMVTKAKLSREVQTQLDRGSEKAITPKGDYSASATYAVNDLVYVPEVNASYVSLISVNEDNYPPYYCDGDDACWMKTTDGEYIVGRQVSEISSALTGYFTCGTEGDVSNKQVSNSSDYHREVNGGAMKVKMANANTASNVKMQFANDVSPITLLYNGEVVDENNTWEEGEVISVYYDGTYNNNAGAYFASNAQGGGGKAEKIKYDNSQSGIAATNVQGAIDTNSASISGAGNYIGGVIGSDIIPSSSVGWAQGVINSTTGAIVSSTKRCYTSVPILGKTRKVTCRVTLNAYYIHTILEYRSNVINTDNLIKSVFPGDTSLKSYSITSDNYIVFVVAKVSNADITTTDAGNYAVIEQASEDLNCKGLNDLQGTGKVVNLTIPTWTVGRLDSNGANTASNYHLRSPFIRETGIIELYAGDELYIESVFIYNDAVGNTKYATIEYDKSLERVRYTVESDYISRVVLKRRDGAAMTSGMGGLLVGSNVQANSRLFSVEEKADDVDARLTDVEDKLIGGEETAITLHKNGYWRTNGWELYTGDGATGYSYSDPIPVSVGQRIKVTLNVGAGAYGVYGSETNVFAAGGKEIVDISTEVNNKIITIPDDVNYIFISSRNEDFTPPFSPSASFITGGWLDEKIENAIEQSAFANPFNGLKLVTLGDSITQGQVISGTAPAKPFPVLVAEELGMNLVNYGIGGSTIGTCANYGGTFASLADFNAATKDTTKYYVVMTGNQTYSDYRYNGSSWVTTTIAMRTPLVDRYDLMDADADIILVAGGTNDFQYNWADIGDITDNVKTTFRGALNVLCNGLITKYPQKCIIFMTPIKRCQTQQAAAANSDTTAHRGGSYGTIDSQNDFGKTLKEYGDIIKEMCARYSIPVIDMYAECMLNPQLSAQSSLFDSYKTHPFQDGHNLMARLIVGKLKSIFGMNV